MKVCVNSGRDLPVSSVVTTCTGCITVGQEIFVELNFRGLAKIFIMCNFRGNKFLCLLIV